MGEETANVALDPNGDITILIGTAVERAGPPDRLCAARRRAVRRAAGARARPAGRHRQDRDRPRHRRFGSIPTGGVSVERATRDLGGKLKEIAAEALEASAGDLEISNGIVRVAGTDRSISFADLAKRPGVDPVEAECERDLRAGRRHLSERHASGRSRDRSRHRHHQDRQLRHRRRFRRDAQSAAARRPGPWRRDAGHRPGADGAGGLQRKRRPARHRHLHGLCAAARGRRPVIRTSRPTTCRCTTNPLGVKGAGEAGAIGSCPAVVNAIVEGLWREYKIDHIDMPATAERVWIAIREAQNRHNL